MTTPDYWYRYDDTPGEGGVYIAKRAFPVLRYTPKGVWLNVWGTDRFVRRDALKRFACPTLKEAQLSFRARKSRQLAILKGQERRVRVALSYTFPKKSDPEWSSFARYSDLDLATLENRSTP